MLEMRLSGAISGGPGVQRLSLILPVQIALRVQPGHRVPLGAAQCLQLVVVCRHVGLAIVGHGRQVPVVLQLVLEPTQLRDDPFALAALSLVAGGVRGAVDVVDALGDDDGPSLARRDVGERGRVARVVLGCHQS